MTVTTDDETTLIRMVREGLATEVKLRFSLRHWRFMYEIKTNL